MPMFDSQINNTHSYILFKSFSSMLLAPVVQWAHTWIYLIHIRSEILVRVLESTILL